MRLITVVEVCSYIGLGDKDVKRKCGSKLQVKDKSGRMKKEVV